MRKPRDFDSELKALADKHCDEILGKLVAAG